MKVLYIFPHPDDESFGPAPAMAAQLRAGHEVFLLTYTKGGATKVRFKLGYSVEKMGEVRYREMLRVAKALQLTGMKVLDLPDSGLKELNPLELEAVTEEHIREIAPDVVVTYAVHGISGFHDHLVTHAVVKRVFCKLREEWPRAPKRLALFTLAESEKDDGKFRLNVSNQQEIDCAVPVTAEDLGKGSDALDCYDTYQEIIREAKVLERIGNIIYFEFFQEEFDPHVTSVFEALPQP
ncbi:MAG: PIG-L family deacetylase [Balneolales bacterium]